MPEIKKIPIDQLNILVFPGNPWELQRAHEKWEESLEQGHTQLLFKCIHCSLEFMISTFRTKNEYYDEIGPQNVYCPECGTKGKVGLIGTKHQPKAICEFASTFKVEQ